MAPLTGDFTWTETATVLKVNVPLHNVPAKSVDCVTTGNYIKISFGQWLIHIDLFGTISEEVKSSKATVKNGTLTLKCVKDVKGVWGKLEVDGKGVEGVDQTFLKDRRSEGLSKREARMQEMDEISKSKAIEEERMALRKQMDLEQKERQDIENLKEEEKEQAEAEVYRTFAEMEKKREQALPPPPKAQTTVKVKESPKKKATKYEDDENDSEEEDMPAKVVKSGGENIWEDSEIPVNGTYDLDRDALEDQDIDDEGQEEGEEEAVGEDYDNTIYDDELDSSAPAVRRSQKATFKYTPRLFKTPMRESTVGQEKDFVAKNRPHLHNHGLLNKDALDVSETDPQWLKGKGDDMFRGGDYRGAINAYSSAFEANSTFVGCISNRASCYLKLNEPARALADLTDAMKISSKEEVEVAGGKAGFWRKVLVKRGMAHCQLGLFEDSKEDYEKALKLAGESGSEGLKSDLKRGKRGGMGNLKKSGDKKFSGGDVHAAIDLYTSALENDCNFVSAVSNRAGCYASTGQWGKCIVDCTKALDLLSDMSLSSGPVPPPGSEKRRDWVVRTICRRGKARVEEGDYKGGVGDFEEAMKIIPEGRQKVRDDLQDDIVKLKKLIV
ncbi:hypothetical protein TL16_g05459 [Triparma laevis f. inornata]|uniref:CS domain-containing protein n=1 Tax=Triparma laevis f. inornata TaxID=1714386 RepID=A0A9W7E9N9_9STRA|nr:hypothetical protein TL16_g05459 [Triparma laevis f. inornata]